MLVAGCQGHAKEVLEVLHQNQMIDHLFFFDDISEDSNEFLYGKYKIIKSLEEARILFKKNPEFILGTGNPNHRKVLSLKLQSVNGKLTTVISSNSIVGHYDVLLGEGLNIMSNVFISNSVSIGEGCLINAFASIHHDVIIGSYCEISPFSVILGGAEIGELCMIGGNSTILPNVKIGNNVIVGAGTVVTKNLPDNSVAIGVLCKDSKTQ